VPQPPFAINTAEADSTDATAEQQHRTIDVTVVENSTPAAGTSAFASGSLSVQQNCPIINGDDDGRGSLSHSASRLSAPAVGAVAPVMVAIQDGTEDGADADTAAGWEPPTVVMGLDSAAAAGTLGGITGTMMTQSVFFSSTPFGQTTNDLIADGSTPATRHQLSTDQSPRAANDAEDAGTRSNNTSENDDSERSVVRPGTAGDSDDEAAVAPTSVSSPIPGRDVHHLVRSGDVFDLPPPAADGVSITPADTTPAEIETVDSSIVGSVVAAVIAAALEVATVSGAGCTPCASASTTLLPIGVVSSSTPLPMPAPPTAADLTPCQNTPPAEQADDQDAAPAAAAADFAAATAANNNELHILEAPSFAHGVHGTATNTVVVGSSAVSCCSGGCSDLFLSGTFIVEPRLMMMSAGGSEAARSRRSSRVEQLQISSASEPPPAATFVASAVAAEAGGGGSSTPAGMVLGSISAVAVVPTTADAACATAPFDEDAPADLAAEAPDLVRGTRSPCVDLVAEAGVPPAMAPAMVARSVVEAGTMTVEDDSATRPSMSRVGIPDERVGRLELPSAAGVALPLDKMTSDAATSTCDALGEMPSPSSPAADVTDVATSTALLVVPGAPCLPQTAESAAQTAPPAVQGASATVAVLEGATDGFPVVLPSLDGTEIVHPVDDVPDRNQAAVKIQATWRGYADRRAFVEAKADYDATERLYMTSHSVEAESD
jgi:hypothetical protein